MKNKMFISLVIIAVLMSALILTAIAENNDAATQASKQVDEEALQKIMNGTVICQYRISGSDNWKNFHDTAMRDMFVDMVDNKVIYELRCMEQ